MPTYEYSCSSCDTRHEVQQKMTDASLTECPSCGTSGLRKLFTNVGVVFKGSGFYRNDSRDKGSSSGSASDSSSSAKPSSDSSSKSGSTDSSSAGSTSDSSAGSKSDSSAGSKSGSKSASPAPAAAPA